MRKHLIGRRLLSLFVALALAVTVLPASPAFAQEEVVAEPVETSGQEEVTAEPAGEDVPDVPADDVSVSGQEEESLGAPAEQEYELSDNPNGDPLYGGEVVCRGISASVTEDTLEEDTHTLTIHIASAEAGKNMSTKGYTWTLYSPTTKAFAESVYSSVASARDVVHEDTSDLTAEGDDITLTYQADETNDYQLVCVYMKRQGAQIAGLLYTADNVTSLMKDGKFSFNVISQPTGNGSGIHVFSVRSNFFKSTDSVVLHTDANASNAAGRYEIAVDPDGELPRAIEVDLYHAFWGKDGQVMLGGYGEEEADVVASYNADNKMLEYSLLKKEYNFSTYRTTRLYKTTDVQSIRLFALNDTTSAPISSAWERPEFIYASEATVGMPGQKGYAVVDIDGTGTEGEVSLSTPKPVSYAAVNGARTIRVVDARIDNGRGQLEGVAELRIKYQSDGEAGDLFYGRLVPGYYNRETGEWETVPYLIDEEDHEVVIFAEHFSIFGLFDADCSGTRTAFVKEADPARLANMRAKTAEVILAPYENQLPDPASGDIVGRTLAELDGYANGKIVFGTATFETLQSKLRKLDTGKFGKTMTAIGIAGAVLSVANNAYHKGFNDTDTLEAVVNLGANVTTASMKEIQTPVAWAAVVVGTASAIYQYHIESKQLVHNDQIDRLYTKWEQRQPWGKWKQKDWAKNVIDKQYKQYFTNGKGLPIENYQNYMNHLDEAISGYPHQFAVAYQTGELERMFPGEMPTDNDFEGNLSYISDLCDYQTANLFLYLEPYLRAQSREAYCRALSSLEPCCAQFREEMNKTITVNFTEEVEEGQEPKTKDCSLRIARAKGLFETNVTMDQDDWTVPFDDAGKATVSFTGVAWAEMGCSEFFQVIDPDGKVIGVVELPEHIDIGENTYDVPFDASAFFCRVRIYEERADADDGYRYAGCKLRLGEVPLKKPGTSADFDKLDENGNTVVYFDPERYRALGSPNALEVLKNGKVIKTVPFDESMTVVVLRSADLLVNVSCEDENAVKHYKDGIAELKITARNGEDILRQRADIQKDGTALIAVNFQKLDYYGMDSMHELLVMGGIEATHHKRQGRRAITPEFRRELQFDEDGVCNVKLMYTPVSMDDPDYEPLVMDKSSVTTCVGAQVPIRVVSGRVGSSKSSRPEVASASASCIFALSAGSTVIKFTDEGNPDNKWTVHVTVTDANVEPFGIYTCVQIYSEEIDLLNQTHVIDTEISNKMDVYAVNLLGNIGAPNGYVAGIRLLYPKNYTPEPHPTQFGWSNYDYAVSEYSQLESVDPLDPCYDYMYHYNYEMVETFDEDGNLTYVPYRKIDKNRYITCDQYGMWFELTENFRSQPSGYTSPVIFGTTRYLFTRTVYPDLDTAFASEEFHNFDWQTYNGGGGGGEGDDEGGGEGSSYGSFAGVAAETESVKAVPRFAELTQEAEAETLEISETEKDTPEGSAKDLTEETDEQEEALPAIPEDETEPEPSRDAPVGSTDELQADENGFYEVSVSGTEAGKLYTILSLSGEHAAFPEQTVTQLEDDIRYVDVISATGDTLTLKFAPIRSGNQTVFVTQEGGTPVIAGYIHAEEEAYEPGKCTVSFDATDGSGNKDAVKVDFGSEYELPDCDFDAPEGKTFSKWDLGYPGDVITVYQDTVLKAKWKDITYTVRFDANGGSGTMYEEQVKKGGSFTVPFLSQIVRDGYSFRQWNTLANGSGTAYTPGTSITVESDLTLFVIWNKIEEQSVEETIPDEVDEGDRPEDPVYTTKIWVSGVTDQEYTGKALTQEFRVYDGTKKLTPGTDYTVSYKNNTKVYTLAPGDDGFVEKNAPQVILKLKGNYSGTQTVFFKITAVDIGDNTAFAAEDLSVQYNKKKQTPVPVLMWNGKKLKANTDFYVQEYQEAAKDQSAFTGDAHAYREYTLTLKGKGNFGGSRRIKLKIAGNDTAAAGGLPVVLMSKVSVTKIPDQIYTGNAITVDDLKDAKGKALGFAVTNKGKMLTPGADYDLTISNNTEVGTATITLTGKNANESETGYSFSGSKTVTFKIKGTAMSKVTVAGIAKSYAFDGVNPVKPDQLGTVSLSYKQSATVTDHLGAADYDITYKNNDKAGTGEILFTGKGKYTGTKSVKFKILPCSIDEKDNNANETVVIVPATTGYVKGGATPSVTVVCNGRVLTEGQDYTLKYKNHDKIYTDASFNTKNPPTVEIRGKGNYTGSRTYRFLISKRVLTKGWISLVAYDKVASQKANQYLPSLTVTDKTSGKELKAGKDYQVATCFYMDDTDIFLKSGRNTVPEHRAERENVDRSDIIPAGTRLCVRIRGINNYDGTLNAEYMIIDPAGDIAKATFAIADQEYTGKAVKITDMDQFLQKGGVTQAFVKVGNVPVPLTLDTDFEVVSYTNNTANGTAKVLLHGIGNYAGYKTVSFKIVKKNSTPWWKGLFARN